MITVQLIETQVVEAKLRSTCPGCKKSMKGDGTITDVSLVNYFYYGYGMTNDGQIDGDPYDSSSNEVEGVVDYQCADCGTSLVVWPKEKKHA